MDYWIRDEHWVRTKNVPLAQLQPSGVWLITDAKAGASQRLAATWSIDPRTGRWTAS